MKRILELDALRGCAAVTIVAYHTVPWSIHWGWVAVDFFFVLSGYLITSIIINNNQKDLFILSFYARRSLRIWPLYYLALTACVILNGFMPHPEPVDGTSYYYAYLQNVHRYWGQETPPFLPYFSHTWTLAIEEQFYIIWPALICLVGPDRLPVLGVTLVILSVAARGMGVHFSLLAARCDGFALGGILAAMFCDPCPSAQLRRHYLSFFAILGLATAIPLAVIISQGQLQQNGSGLAWKILLVNLLFFCALALVLMHAGHPLLAVLRNPVLCYVGLISYGIYLYHFFLCFISREINARYELGYPRWIPFAVLGASIAIAAVSWELIERPILRLKRWFHYAKGAHAG